jgi:acetoacetyl-CoA reductase
MARVAVVTGGTRGIGLAITEHLHAAGFKVAAVYSGNAAAAAACKERLPGVECFKWDVGDTASCADGLAKVEAALGPVDTVVNNAGITRDGMFHKMTIEQWSEVIQVNLTSLFNMTRPVIEGMRARGFGRIINISSINGQKGQMGQVNYSAAKAGVIGFTKALAQENAFKGITVNAIAPGYIDTDMVSAVPEETLKKIISTIPVGRLGKAEEIAACVGFLADEKNGFMTGATLTINGGQYFAA